MKKIILSLIAVMACMSISAQVIKVYKNNSTTPEDTYTNTATDKYKVVFEGEVKVTTINVTAETNLVLPVGRTSSLTLEVLPATATDKSVTWTSSNKTVATVDASGKVSDLSTGKTTITATANDGSGVSGTYTLTVVGWVQLWAGGPKFATMNVGASTETGTGSTMNYADAAKTGTDYVWGKNWKTPSKAEMDLVYFNGSSSMYEYKSEGNGKVKYEYTTQDGVYGFKFTGVQNGYTNNSLFLPGTIGYLDYDYSCYWSSSANGSNAWRLDLMYNEGEPNYICFWYSSNKPFECSVRPVLSE